MYMDVYIYRYINTFVSFLFLFFDYQVNYDYKTEEFSSQKFPSETQLGWIAQDVQKVVPELVTRDDDGFLYVSYSHGVPLIGQAVTELSGLVDENFQALSECVKQEDLKGIREELDEKNSQILHLQNDLTLFAQKLADMELLLQQFIGDRKDRN